MFHLCIMASIAILRLLNAPNWYKKVMHFILICRLDKKKQENNHSQHLIFGNFANRGRKSLIRNSLGFCAFAWRNLSQRGSLPRMKVMRCDCNGNWQTHTINILAMVICLSDSLKWYVRIPRIPYNKSTHTRARARECKLWCACLCMLVFCVPC